MLKRLEVQNIGELFYICQRHPGRFLPFCNIDPRLPKNPKTVTEKDFEFLLEQYLTLGCKGIGEMTARVPWNNSSMRELLKACNKFKLPLTFHTVTEDFDGYGVIDKIGLPLLEEALKEFSDIKFFGHSMAFWSEISGGIKDLEEKNGCPASPIKSTGRIQNLMRQYPNLYGDLSADSGLNALNRDVKHAYEFLDEFQDRLMFGLDTCVANGVPQKHLEWFKSALKQGDISNKIYEKIMWKNANKLLELGLE
ncbi:MAG: hypothetical protein A2Y12_09205 [Planctomycetes bacterium GWF2_42_9]|nr:MAG: hypothetical protein A2Y12_09205 [Planctomycetes bacterium GWF2_42_9]